MPEPTIRPASEADLPTMCDLLAELFELEQDFEPDRARQEAGLRLMFASPLATLLVAESEGETAGFIGCQLLVSTARGGWSGHIEDVVVADKFRRRGIGQKLIDAAEQWARGRGAVRMELNCDDQNTPAMAFYEKNRWEKTHLFMLFRHDGCGD